MMAFVAALQRLSYQPVLVKAYVNMCTGITEED